MKPIPLHQHAQSIPPMPHEDYQMQRAEWQRIFGLDSPPPYCALDEFLITCVPFRNEGMTGESHQGLIYVNPSDHPGYCHVALFRWIGERTQEATVRPIKNEAIPSLLTLVGFDLSSFKWKSEPQSAPVSKSPHWFDGRRGLVQGQVYLIEAPDHGLVKIGYSDYPESRLRSLQYTSPAQLRLIGTIDGPRTMEAKIHRDLRHQRHHGEWFVFDDKTQHILEESWSWTPSQSKT